MEKELEKLKAIIDSRPRDPREYNNISGIGFGYFGEWSLANLNLEEIYSTNEYHENWPYTDSDEYVGIINCVGESIRKNLYIDVFDNEMSRDAFLLGLKYKLATSDISEEIKTKINEHYFSDTPKFVTLDTVNGYISDPNY